MNSRISSWLPRLGVAFAVPLLAAALLPLALLQGPAAVQASDPPPQEAAVEVAAPDCSSSPLGNRVRLFGEDEIGMAGALSGTALLENIWADNSGQNLVKTGNWLGGGGSVLSNIAYPAIAMADLNGDGAKEQILAFRDSLQRIAVSIGSTYLQESWYHSSFVGDDVRWIDVAAGNLDRSEDGDEEIVLGFSNDAHAATVILLDGSRAAQIGNESDSMLGGYWGDTTNGRGEVQFLNVATGDLTGNGYDDDIIVAFKDGNADLQVWILRRDPILRFVWWKAWQDHDRGDVAADCPGSGYSNVHPIDVTTGDIDGDKQDEVILA
ncbi:MAG: hypothetical protein FJ026_12210, partial [Chloroflexi bacterium]|nr:hypothetical protein [Chloroflexota bacterium]